MRVLEARFHPLGTQGADSVLVGHVVWEPDHEADPPMIRPAAALVFEKAPLTMLAKLRHLVEISGPDAFARLPLLASRYWSFLDVSPELARADVA